MLIPARDLKPETKPAMRGGSGTITVHHLVPAEHLKGSRLIAKVVVPPGGSIGNHEHLNETEYYHVLQGRGEYVDNGKTCPIAEDDTTVTLHGESHGVRNTGSEHLALLAIIVLHSPK